MADSADDKPAAAPEGTATTTSATSGDSDTPQAAPADPHKPTMKIKVYAPFQIYFDGEGYSITATNETGPFDILPRHHNFLCMLVPCDLVIKTPYETKTIRIARALMHVKAERVAVFVDV